MERKIQEAMMQDVSGVMRGDPSENTEQTIPLNRFPLKGVRGSQFSTFNFQLS